MRPHINIGPDYLHRWFNIYLHRILKDDDDHPWHSVSIRLRGVLREIRRGKSTRIINHPWPVFRRASDAHRLEVVAGPVWTLFMTGPRIRERGFWCPKGCRHWSVFTSGKRGETIGRGCE